MRWFAQRARVAWQTRACRARRSRGCLMALVTGELLLDEGAPDNRREPRRDRVADDAIAVREGVGKHVPVRECLQPCTLAHRDLARFVGVEGLMAGVALAAAVGLQLPLGADHL